MVFESKTYGFVTCWLSECCISAFIHAITAVGKYFVEMFDKFHKLFVPLQRSMR